MSNETGGTDAKTPWYAHVLTCLILLVLAAIIIAVLWFVGNWIWDFVGGLFDGGSGGGGRLAKYCAGKFARGSYLYRECIADGWKPWYSTAHWLN